MPHVEFAYSHYVHSATKLTPLQVVYDFNLLSLLDMVVLPLKEQTNLHSKRNSKFLKYLHESIQKNIEEMTKIYSRKATMGYTEFVAEPGDMI